MKHLYVLLAAVTVASTIPPEPKTCIDYCKCEPNDVPSRLKIIECDRPLVLNETTFRHVNKKDISVISFENVIITQIQESVFRGFTHLEDVLILNSKIGSIDAKSFNYIKRLKFANCGFEDSPDLFSEKLEELHFGSCQIEEIPKLNGLLSLTFLNLTGNYIKDIGIETFAELYDLAELYLSYNEIFKLSANLFINNQDLNSLYLDHNPLKSFYLNTSENLETLFLSNCHLETFDEDSTQRLSSVSELDLSNNRIKRITGKALSHLEDLFTINLANNQLEELDDDVFSGNSDLNKITLDGNKFSSLPNFFLKGRQVFSTYTFSCNNCGLKSLSSSVFENMPGLKEIQLSHNDFINVDNMFQKTPSMNILDISYNKISYISPLAFAKSMNLESLNIAGNPLASLNPEVFARSKLKEINARNTSLEMLWSNKNVVIPTLKQLYVSDNKLTSLTTDDLKVMPILDSIDLNNNPLNFSNEFCGLIKWTNINIRPIDNTNELDVSLEGHYIENPHNFHAINMISWKNFYADKCPDVFDDPNAEYDDSEFYDDEEDDEDDEDDEDIDSDDTTSRHISDEVENNNLARASYILSVTSVFILTALVVLTLAVTVTLTILRRNNNFNMHKANLPRLKIPMWHSTPGQKKHSGSVYRPLSEDLSGPKTPKLSRYEFTSSPTVHSSNP